MSLPRVSGITDRHSLDTINHEVNSNINLTNGINNIQSQSDSSYYPSDNYDNNMLEQSYMAKQNNTGNTLTLNVAMITNSKINQIDISPKKQHVTSIYNNLHNTTQYKLNNNENYNMLNKLKNNITTPAVQKTDKHCFCSDSTVNITPYKDSNIWEDRTSITKNLLPLLNNVL